MFQPGEYEVISNVNVRKEPRVTWYNRVGMKPVGHRVNVLSVQTNNDNSTWGRISEPDAAGVSLWCCIQDVNRQFMKPLDPVVDGGLLARFEKLVTWAKTQGYRE